MTDIEMMGRIDFLVRTIPAKPHQIRAGGMGASKLRGNLWSRIKSRVNASRPSQLDRDKYLLWRVCSELRKPLLYARHQKALERAKEASRTSALTAGNKKADRMSDRRRFFVGITRMRCRGMDWAAKRDLQGETAFRRNECRRLGVAAKSLLVSQPHRKLARTLRRRFEKAFKSRKSSGYIRSLCGTTLASLKERLEDTFKPGMSWDNYGFTGWHIDHIRPCASFDLTDPAQVSQCFHFSNLQPLWAKDNLTKGARYGTLSVAEGMPALLPRRDRSRPYI